MKKLSFLSVALLYASPLLAQACPDFSGSFHSSDPAVKMGLVTTQNKCRSIDFVYHDLASGQAFGKTYRMDNKRYQTYEDQNLIVYETAGVQGTDLVNIVEDIEKASGTVHKAVSHFRIDPAGDMVGEDFYYDTNGNIFKTVQHTYQRVLQ